MALKVGDKAPEFTLPSDEGKEISLKDYLGQRVVLYFYPAAFTKGCTIEAHLFADAVDKYKALGASVIGVSADNIDTLNKFSISECRSKFAVASDQDQNFPFRPNMAHKFRKII